MKSSTPTPSPRFPTSARATATAVLALVGVLGLSGCDAMRGPNDQGDCHINDNYEIKCDVVGDNGSLGTP